VPGPVWLPEVVGDPAGMRALASTLRSAASQIGQVESGIGSAVAGMTFEGPAGTRFRSRAGGIGRVARSAAATLEDVAGTLERSAAQVEQQQADRLRKLQQMQDELARAKAGSAA
jgi:uncharacterized protein YukE